MTVRGARTHLWPVGRQPRYLKSSVESRFGQHFAQQQDALSAKPGHAHLQIDAALGFRIGLFCRTLVLNAENPRNILERGPAFLRCLWLHLLRAIAKDAER